MHKRNTLNTCVLSVGVRNLTFALTKEKSADFDTLSMMM